MRLGVLGPLLVLDDAGEEVPVAAPRQRALLAALVMRPNLVVSPAELAELVWDGAPTDAGVRTVRSYMLRLRRALGPAIAARIETRDPGYLFRLGQDEVDAREFEALCRAAGSALRAREWAEAADAAVAALALWRDEPLRDVPSQVLRARVVPRLEQLRVQALEDRTEADLQLGRHARLVPQLKELTAAYPLRERFRAQLMVALARSGRQAEALETYREARRALVRELGVEPGPELRALHEKILSGKTDAAARPPAAEPAAHPGSTVPPRLLPAGVPHFAGRAAQLKALAGIAAGAGQPGTVVITALDGTAGVGKTALAVHWAHRVADRFPDGQLYVNLRGFDPAGPPLDPAVAVRRFLDALAMPAARIPADRDAQADLYRSALAGRRMLILLDNARDTDQVRPLLPGTAGCLVLVTSRSRLTGLVALDGAIPLPLDLLGRDEARELLARRLGPERVDRERHAVDRLIDLCARLPLALNIAAAHAATRPDTPLDALADQLRDDRRRLDVLSAEPGGADVRAVFFWSYRTLSGPAARLFRLLGVHSGPDISAAAAASLAALDPDLARRALEELASAHLLAEPVSGRYALHDLLRAYAAELAERTDAEADRREAVHRMLDHYLHTLFAADKLLDPTREPIVLAPARPGVLPESMADPAQVWRWYRIERPVVLAALSHAVRAGFDTHAWQLAWSVADCLQRQGHLHDQIDVHRIALAAAQRLDDLPAQAYAYRVLGRAHTGLRAFEDARAELQHAFELHQTLGDLMGQAAAQRGLAWAYEREDRVDCAFEHARRALELYRAAGDSAGVTTGLNALAWLHARRGEYEQAVTACLEALELHRGQGLEYAAGEANAWESLGYAYHHLGRFTEAIESYQRALPLLREQGERYFEADTLSYLGDTYDASGDQGTARDCWLQALAILDDLHHPDVEQVRGKLQRLDARDD